MRRQQRKTTRRIARSSRPGQARHVFVAVLGQTPQIVTETLYALMIERRIPVSEVYVITTQSGAERARRDLLDPENGQFVAFCREYGFDPRAIAFDEAHILTIKKTANGRRAGRARGSAEDIVLEDIRTVEDNRHLAEQLLGIIQRLTDDPNTILHGSIAGGRKTMSAYMLLAFTLYGREQDRLYHVLVPEPFEHNPQFFFPPRRPRVIGIGVGQVASTEQARIELAEIPFVRLRPWILKEKRLRRTIEEQIRHVQRELDRQAEQWEPLVIDFAIRQARLGDRVLPLSGVKLALFAYFAEQRAGHSQHAQKDARMCPECFQDFSSLNRPHYRELCRRIVVGDPEREFELFPALFLSYRSKINRALRREGFPEELQIVNISTTSRHARYGLRLDPRRIRFHPSAVPA